MKAARAGGHDAARTRAMRRVVRTRGSKTPSLAEGPRPQPTAGEAHLRSLLVGLDGTDNAVLEDDHAFPAGEAEIVLGHECLAEVIDAPAASGHSPGDRVVPLVRHGCGECAPCAGGRSDMCATGRYREHGIKALHGFLREEWVDDPATLVRVPEGLDDLAVLAEPLSIVVKAMEVVDGIQRRAPDWQGFAGARVLLAGTGSLGTLAAFALAHEGADVHAIDRSSGDSAAAKLIARLGARHTDTRGTSLREVARREGGFDLVIEATGSPRVAFDSALGLRENGIVCLLGVPSERPPMPLQADDVMRDLVLKNACIVGSVNSNARHIATALDLLGRFHDRWPTLVDQVITHRFAAERAAEAFELDDESVIKKVIEW